MQKRSDTQPTYSISRLERCSKTLILLGPKAGPASAVRADDELDELDALDEQNVLPSLSCHPFHPGSLFLPPCGTRLCHHLRLDQLFMGPKLGCAPIVGTPRSGSWFGLQRSLSCHDLAENTLKDSPSVELSVCNSAFLAL